MPETPLPAAHTHLSLADIFKYAVLIEEIITIGEQAKALPVGSSQAVPAIKFKANGHSYVIAGDKITRTE